ncbi:uncharacterized protein LOC142358033 [Convolutriloba macropyga]|uniref:uncharacterized protein LOC142358033 n=1 Tax=Convolutriloba macropyga TaxID=536237 RepID=UPI003F526744
MWLVASRLVLSLWTAVERLADYVIFWLPLYYEAKVLSVIFLWHPKTQGALYLYATMVQPWMISNQPAIDSNIDRAQTWVAQKISANFNRAMSYVQYRAHEAIAYMQEVSQRQGQGGAPQPVASGGSFSRSGGSFSSSVGQQQHAD